MGTGGEVSTVLSVSATSLNLTFHFCLIHNCVENAGISTSRDELYLFSVGRSELLKISTGCKGQAMARGC